MHSGAKSKKTQLQTKMTSPNWQNDWLQLKIHVNHNAASVSWRVGGQAKLDRGNFWFFEHLEFLDICCHKYRFMWANLFIYLSLYSKDRAKPFRIKFDGIYLWSRTFAMATNVQYIILVATLFCSPSVAAVLLVGCNSMNGGGGQWWAAAKIDLVGCDVR